MSAPTFRISVAALRACLEVRRQIVAARRIAALSNDEFLVWLES